MWFQILSAAPGELGLGCGFSPASSLPGNLEKSCDHPASELVRLSTSFYHTGHIFCSQGYKIRGHNRSMEKKVI